jgi:tetratricopeptide (TPR) repeat protein
MHRYGVREVQKLLRLPRSTIRALVDAGFVAPERGPRNAWLFSFQDLVVLRAAQTLTAAKVPPRRITRSVRELRRHLPDAMPLSGLSICAVGDRVVVKERGTRWQAESGQYLLEFDGDPDAGSFDVLVRDGADASPNAEAWFEQALRLEGSDPVEAIDAYRRAILADPTLVDASINLGRLLHENGRLAEAERVYRKALETNMDEPVLFYNLGVLLEDMNRKTAAAEAYEHALRGDPTLADCHYNLALLYEDLAKPRDAIRHMAEYRKLTHEPR